MSHYYTSLKHVQEKRLFPSAHLVRVLALCNAGMGCLYLHVSSRSTVLRLQRKHMKGYGMLTLYGIALLYHRNVQFFMHLHTDAYLCLPSQWRWTETFPDIGRWDYTEWIFYWWWTFFLAEVFLAIAVWIGLAQRLFPVQRIKVLCYSN